MKNPIYYARLLLGSRCDDDGFSAWETYEFSSPLERASFLAGVEACCGIQDGECFDTHDALQAYVKQQKAAYAAEQ